MPMQACKWIRSAASLGLIITKQIPLGHGFVVESSMIVKQMRSFIPSPVKMGLTTKKGKNKQPIASKPNASSTNSFLLHWYYDTIKQYALASRQKELYQAECISWLTKETMSGPFGGIHTTLSALRPDLALWMQRHAHGFLSFNLPDPEQLCWILLGRVSWKVPQVIGVTWTV